MATVFDSVSIRGLRIAHFKQLLAYAEHKDFYYGNKDQFNKRHIEIIDWLERTIGYAETEGVIIPKWDRR